MRRSVRWTAFKCITAVAEQRQDASVFEGRRRGGGV